MHSWSKLLGLKNLIKVKSGIEHTERSKGKPLHLRVKWMYLQFKDWNNRLKKTLNKLIKLILKFY